MSYSAFGVYHGDGIAKRQELVLKRAPERDKSYTDKLKTGDFKAMSGKEKAGTAAGAAATVAGGVYGRAVGRAAMAARGAAKFTDDVASRYNQAASKYSGPEGSYLARLKLRTIPEEVRDMVGVSSNSSDISLKGLKEQRKFRRETPGAKTMRRMANRWEPSFEEKRAIQNADANRSRGIKDVLLHPTKTRRSADKKVLDTALNNGTAARGPMYRGHLKGDKNERYSSWTPSSRIANTYADNAETLNRHMPDKAPLGGLLGVPGRNSRGIPSDVPRNTKGKVTSRDVGDSTKYTRLGPVSRMMHDEHIAASGGKARS